MCTHYKVLPSIFVYSLHAHLKFLLMTIYRPSKHSIKGLIPWETVYYSSFWNTIGHSEWHIHAESENVLLPRLPALHRLTGHLLLLLTNAKLIKKLCNDTFETFFVTLSWRQVESVCSVSCRAFCLFVLVLVVFIKLNFKMRKCLLLLLLLLWIAWLFAALAGSELEFCSSPEMTWK